MDTRPDTTENRNDWNTYSLTGEPINNGTSPNPHVNVDDEIWFNAQEHFTDHTPGTTLTTDEPCVPTISAWAYWYNNLSYADPTC